MRSTSALIAAAVLAYAAPAYAAPARGACRVSASQLAFGEYDPFSSTPLDGDGAIEVTCNAGVTYVVRIDTGQNGGAGSVSRGMRSHGQSILYYDLYLDPSRTQVWGDGIGNGSAETRVASGSTDRLQVYGRIPPLQNVSSGTYRDRVIVTVDF